MKKIIISVLMVMLLVSCNKENNTIANTPKLLDTIVNLDLNLMISPDLSNRITDRYAKPIDDTAIIGKILDLYYPFVYKSDGRTIGQKDKISIQITNPQLFLTYNIDNEPLEIDLSTFSNEERIKYLTDLSITKNFNNDKKRLLNEITKTYKEARLNTVGADIYNLFNSRISNDLIFLNGTPVKSFDKYVINKKRNILILITDGYIEAGLYNKPVSGNRYYHLDNDLIRKFRKEFLASDETDMKKFFHQQGYGLIPVKNEALKNLEVFAVEFYDRSLSKTSGNNTILPDDYDILKLFWEDWLTNSQVKKFKIYERFAEINELERAFKNFILED